MARPDVAKLLSRARALTDADEARRFYDDWAETYDDDVYATLRITGTARIAALLHGFTESLAAPVLDAGCGTGAAGKELRDLGFITLDGLDLSPGMLAVARRRGVYRGLLAADLMKPLPLEARSYDAILSAGTFTLGHVNARPLRALVSVVRPQGLLAFVVGSSFWSEGGFDAAISGLNAGREAATLYCAEEPIAAEGRDRGWFVVLRRLR